MTTSADTRAQAPSKMREGSKDLLKNLLGLLRHTIWQRISPSGLSALLSPTTKWIFLVFTAERRRKHSLQRSLYCANWFTGIASCLPPKLCRRWPTMPFCAHSSRSSMGADTDGSSRLSRIFSASSALKSGASFMISASSFSGFIRNDFIMTYSCLAPPCIPILPT